MDMEFKADVIEGKVVLVDTSTVKVDKDGIERELYSIGQQKDNILEQVKSLKKRYGTLTDKEQVLKEALKELISKTDTDDIFNMD